MPIKLRKQDKVVGGILFGFAGMAALLSTLFPPTPPVINEERSSYLQNHFGQAISEAVSQPRNTQFHIPAYVREAGDLLVAHSAAHTDIETARNSGDRSATLRAREVENNALIQQAEALFTSEGGSVPLYGIRCERTESAHRYSCDLKIAEFGGVNNDTLDVAACTRLSYSFDVAVTEDGDLTVTNYYEPYDRSLDVTAEQFTEAAESYPRHYLAHIDPAISAFSELDETQLNTGQALLRFGKCLTNG